MTSEDLANKPLVHLTLQPLDTTFTSSWIICLFGNNFLRRIMDFLKFLNRFINFLNTFCTFPLEVGETLAGIWLFTSWNVNKNKHGPIKILHFQVKLKVWKNAIFRRQVMVSQCQKKICGLLCTIKRKSIARPVLEIEKSVLGQNGI